MTDKEKLAMEMIKTAKTLIAKKGGPFNDVMEKYAEDIYDFKNAVDYVVKDYDMARVHGAKDATKIMKKMRKLHDMLESVTKEFPKLTSLDIDFTDKNGRDVFDVFYK